MIFFNVYGLWCMNVRNFWINVLFWIIIVSYGYDNDDDNNDNNSDEDGEIDDFFFSCGILIFLGFF